MIAGSAIFDFVFVEKNLSVACIFSGNEINLFEDAQRAKRDILEIANGRGKDVEHVIFW